MAATAAVALLSTGAAFAASGHAPWSHHALGAGPAAHDTSSATSSTHPGKPTDHPTAHGPNPHAYWGLCHAYAAGNKATHGKALSSRAFEALATAAGGADHVASFCASVPAPRKDHASEGTEPPEPTESTESTEETETASPSHPTHPSKPTDTPSATHPTHPTHPAHPSHSPKPTEDPNPSHSTRQSRP